MEKLLNLIYQIEKEKEKPKPKPKGLNISQGVIGELLELREKLREKGEYQLADQLRTILNKAGIYLEVLEL